MEYKYLVEYAESNDHLDNRGNLFQQMVDTLAEAKKAAKAVVKYECGGYARVTRIADGVCLYDVQQ